MSFHVVPTAQNPPAEATTSIRRLTNVIEIELRGDFPTIIHLTTGIEALKEKFQQGESHVEILNDRWKLILRRVRNRLLRVRASNNAVGTHRFRESSGGIL